MYKKLQNFFIVLSLAILTFGTCWLIVLHKADVKGGELQYLYVSKARSDILDELSKLADEHHVTFAKMISTPGVNATGQPVLTYFPIGKIPLPADLSLQESPTLIKESSNATTYIIIGEGYTAAQAATDLNQMGNEADASVGDNTFSAIWSIIGTFQIDFALLVLLSVYLALVLAQYISEIKKMGLERLSGLSKHYLILRIFVQNIRVTLLSLLGCTLLGSLYFFVTIAISMQFVQIIFTTLAAWSLLLIVLNGLLSFLIYLSLRFQTINLAIKGQVPLRFLTGLMIILQLLSVSIAMFSLSNWVSSNQQLSLLKEGQKAWAENKNYYGLLGTETNGISQDSSNQFLNTLLKDPETLLVRNNFDAQIIFKTGQDGIKDPTGGSGYLFSEYPDQNSLTVNTAFIKKIDLSLSDAQTKQLDSLGVGQAMLLIPQSQRNNYQAIVNSWNVTAKMLKIKFLPSLYTPTKPIFAYPIFSVSSQLLSNQSFASEPILLVYSPQTFVGSPYNMITWQGLLINNPDKILQLAKTYHITTSLSLISGYGAISQHETQLQIETDTIILANVLSIISLVLLISLLNTIYFYQNRRKFLIERLAGKSLLRIHRLYVLIAGLTLLAIVGLAKVFSLPIETYLIPLLYVLIIGGVFSYQLKREKRVDVLYLKGA